MRQLTPEICIRRYEQRQNTPRPKPKALRYSNTEFKTEPLFTKRHQTVINAWVTVSICANKIANYLELIDNVCAEDCETGANEKEAEYVGVERCVLLPQCQRESHRWGQREMEVRSEKWP
jgi:hypothetical protein